MRQSTFDDARDEYLSMYAIFIDNVCHRLLWEKQRKYVIYDCCGSSTE